MSKKHVREVALANGFKLKNQSQTGVDFDLNPYVYEFAAALCGQKNQHIAELRRERNQLKAQNAELIAFLNTAPLSSGVCCCGDSFEGHSQTDHGYVDSAEYAISELTNKAPAACLTDVREKAVRDFCVWADSVTEDDFPELETPLAIMEHYLAKEAKS